MKNKKSIVLAAVSAAIFASISVGTTFALFTSNSQTDVQVSSGKINVSATLNELKVYSAVFDSETEYHEELQTETREEEGGLIEHLFSNGGYAVYNSDQSTLIVDRITPGDLVEFSFDVANDSNVNFKYRFSYVAVDTDEDPSTSYLDLIKGMDTSIKEGEAAPVTYHGLAKYQTAWEVKSADASLDDVEFSLSLPVEAGNEFQDKEAKILISFEAVQANAYTDGDAEIALVEEDIVSDPTIAVQDVATVVAAQSSVSDLSFEVTVPANAEYSSGSVLPDDKLTIEVTDLGKTEEVYTTETSLNFDLTLKVNNQPVNGFTKDLDVKIYVGKGLIISSVKHNNEDVTGYVYDTNTGYITFKTKSFSPFEVSFLSGVEVEKDDELRAALENPNVTTIGLKDDILEAPSRYEITKSVRIVGFGHTIKVTGDDRVFDLNEVNNVEVSFEDVNAIQQKTGSSYTRGISLYASENVTLNIHHSSFSCSYYAINVASGCNNVVVNIDDSSLTAGWCAFQTWSSNTTFNISNSTLVGNNDKKYGTSNNFGTIVVNENVENTKINLVNCTIDSRYNDPTAEQHNLQWAYLFKGSTCNVNSIDCTYILNEEVIEVESFDDLDLNNLVAFTSWGAIYGLTFNLNGNVWHYEAQ